VDSGGGLRTAGRYGGNRMEDLRRRTSRAGAGQNPAAAIDAA
jgi:hypothetical protein